MNLLGPLPRSACSPSSTLKCLWREPFGLLHGATEGGSMIASRVFRSPTTVSQWFLALGAMLVLVAFLSASAIPHQAHRDFDALVQSYGARGLTHTPNYPDVYRRMSADRRLVQNGYIGVSGLVLLAAGAFGMTRERAGSG
jgi:hypothetical protein